MGKSRYIQTKFWDDNFIVELEPEEKLLFLYLFTNPLADICGGYEISVRKMVYDTGIEKDVILKTLEKFEKAEKVFYRDGWILMQNFIKNQVLNMKTFMGIENSLKNCPDWIKDKLHMQYQTLFIEYRKRIEEYRNGIKYSNPNSNSNSNFNTPPTPLETKNLNGNGVSKKNGMGKMGLSKFSEDERRKYAESQTEINDVDAYVNSLRSKRGDFDGRVQKWIAENCPNCRAFNSDRHSDRYRFIPPCPKHSDESFDVWKNKIITLIKKNVGTVKGTTNIPTNVQYASCTATMKFSIQNSNPKLRIG